MLSPDRETGKVTRKMESMQNRGRLFWETDDCALSSQNDHQVSSFAQLISLCGDVGKKCSSADTGNLTNLGCGLVWVFVQDPGIFQFCGISLRSSPGSAYSPIRIYLAHQADFNPLFKRSGDQVSPFRSLYCHIECLKISINSPVEIIAVHLM